MTYLTTTQALAAITDEGLFERIATSILREACPHCCSLTHPGVNASGKTVKAPLDGICYLSGVFPPHLIAVHHTTTALSGLRNKWLHDPAQVAPRKNGKKPTAPSGDLIKTSEIISHERGRNPDLQATLILTTIVEPDEKLVRDVVDAGYKRDIIVDIWSVSRLCHFLDNTPKGQWLRAKFLGIEQELLSPDFLHDLSVKSLLLNRPLESPDVWIDRDLHETLKLNLQRDVIFLNAGSGLGKTVACYRLVKDHVESGGMGLILSHDIIASSSSLEQAIAAELRNLHPSLSLQGPSALEFCSPDYPLFLIVEDINQAGQDAPRLIEKIAGWSNISNNKADRNISSSSWRLICPIWPESLTAVRHQYKACISQLSVIASGFSGTEGTEAVQIRAQLAGQSLSALLAQEIAVALGNDPLLIALHDLRNEPEPDIVIAEYIQSSLDRVSAEDPAHTVAEYLQALHMLAAEMLLHRKLELKWLEVKSWFRTKEECSSLLARIAHKGEVICLVGTSMEERLVFRHDRVRDSLLVDGIVDLYQESRLCLDVVAEPYFAEVLGAAIAQSFVWENMIEYVSPVNPLALFHAFRLSSRSGSARNLAILERIKSWLNYPDIHKVSNNHLRWEALATLARTDSKAVLDIVRKLPDRTFNKHLARLRNGDFLGGVELCFRVEPSVRASWRDVQIEHAKLRFGGELSNAVAEILISPNLNNSIRIGSLRLAGHLADPALGSAIKSCWNSDLERVNILTDYIWAFAECCGDEPAQFLGPACDVWASLPNKTGMDGGLTSSDSFAIAQELNWAFQKWPPLSAIAYFILRAQEGKLCRPMTSMLLGIDHPEAIKFVVQQVAKDLQHIDETNSINIFSRRVVDDWRRAQKNGHSMSRISRDALLTLWQDCETNKYLRTAALDLWAATTCVDDLAILQGVVLSDELFEKVLVQRLLRGDQCAIPEMILRLSGENANYWWGFGRYVWSQDLTVALDNHFSRRFSCSKLTIRDSSNEDWIMPELIIRLPKFDAESILIKYWQYLRVIPSFVQVALFIATPPLRELVESVITESSNPECLFEHLGMHWGFRMKGHPGVTKKEQLQALAPYLHFLPLQEIKKLWDICNEKGWGDLRHEIIDKYMPEIDPPDWWDSDKMQEVLTGMLDAKYYVLLEHRIDDFLKADVSWASMLTSMSEWLEQQHSLKAVEVVASALIYKGRREDLTILKCCEDLGMAALEIIEDTTFAVFRRKIH